MEEGILIRIRKKDLKDGYWMAQGREDIEGRKHTVFAGHVHHYGNTFGMVPPTPSAPPGTVN